LMKGWEENCEKKRKNWVMKGKWVYGVEKSRRMRILSIGRFARRC
jgi:hypothetical protein